MYYIALIFILYCVFFLIEIVHLGALSVRHAQRVDQWGAEVQKTYQKIYADHQKMKVLKKRA